MICIVKYGRIDEIILYEVKVTTKIINYKYLQYRMKRNFYRVQKY